MAAGTTNTLTGVMLRAQEIALDLYDELLIQFGQQPLYMAEYPHTRQPWPKDPEDVSPEEMQYLINVRGEDAVNRWLAEFYMQQAEQDPAAFDLPEGAG